MFKDLVVRPACQESLKDVRPEDQLELVRVAGGYGEVIIDNVGVARNICSLEEVRNEITNNTYYDFYPGLGTKICGSSLRSFINQSSAVSGQFFCIFQGEFLEINFIAAPPEIPFCRL